MKLRLKDRLVVVTAETDEEREQVAGWARPVDGHVFVLVLQDERTFTLNDLGPRAAACRKPINVTSRAVDPDVRLISNFAHTPFELDGRQYASVEAFWQGLKFPDDERRRAIALLNGEDARRAGFDALEAATCDYGGQRIQVGTWAHWQLMTRACRAKFTQHAEARRALVATGERPLAHRTRHDSRTIPGVIMAEIWMSIRRQLASGETPSTPDDAVAD